jgi:6-pyruvoyltetrahydropterin/6-carboxytetrahydropterin synthase
MQGKVVQISRMYMLQCAHFLPKVPDGHKCKRMHGHNFKVEVVLQGQIGSDGFVADYAVIDKAWEHVHEKLDHRLLNEIAGLENPTSENLSVWLFDFLTQETGLACLHSVTVYENERSRCTYAP